MCRWFNSTLGHQILTIHAGLHDVGLFCFPLGEAKFDHQLVVINCRISIYQRQAKHRVSPYPGTGLALVIPRGRKSTDFPRAEIQRIFPVLTGGYVAVALYPNLLESV